jgi:CO/xanthine dehydrogenase Mo-binding subunit
MTEAPANLTRRQFGKVAGGLVLAFSLGPRLAGAQQPKLPGSLANNPKLDAWLRINADGSATIFSGKVELGQGISTALAQIAAEELDLPLPRVGMIAGDTAQTPDEGYTSGSQSIENGGTAIRLACAEARGLLLDHAAQRFNVDADSLKVSGGVITAPDGRELGYGELAAGLDLNREVTGTATAKPLKGQTIVGHSIPRRDIPAKVTGGIAYVQDIRLPGMVHGRVVRPPRYGARLDSFDEAAARAIPGVVAVVRDGSFLGIVSEREEQAVKARSALITAAKWSGGSELPDPARLHEHLMALPTESAVVSEKQGEASPAAQTLEATYTRPYLAHASIGPSCAVAEFKDGRLTVWTHSQGVFPLRRDLAKALKLDLDAVHCVHAEGSGCYGHNGADDVALDAALLARAAPGRPVRVQWMRDDEFAWEPYGSAMLARAKASLDAKGKIVDWVYEVWSNTHTTRPAAPGSDNNLLASWYVAEPSQPGPPINIPQPAGGGDRNAVPLYNFPNQRVVNHLITGMPLRVSALRALGGYVNVFAAESFMDELALAAGQDPAQFRIAHLGDWRATSVIEAVTRRAGWRPAEKGDGARGRGLAFARYKNLAAYVAVIAEVEVDRQTGRIRVPRAYAAVEAGQIINPDGLANQIDGGLIQSTSWTLHEAVRFDHSGITSRDWSGYPILRMPEVPETFVSLLDMNQEKPLGAGEAAQGPMAAAIANAFANATGRRLRDLPFTPERVQALLG